MVFESRGELLSGTTLPAWYELFELTPTGFKRIGRTDVLEVKLGKGQMSEGVFLIEENVRGGALNVIVYTDESLLVLPLSESRTSWTDVGGSLKGIIPKSVRMYTIVFIAMISAAFVVTVLMYLRRKKW